MTIQDARRILGKKVEHLSDEELLKLMIKTDRDLDIFFKQAVKRTKTSKTEKIR